MVKIGPVNIGFPSTRLDVIIEELRSSNHFQYNYIGVSIDSWTQFN